MLRCTFETVNQSVPFGFGPAVPQERDKLGSERGRPNWGEASTRSVLELPKRNQRFAFKFQSNCERKKFGKQLYVPQLVSKSFECI